MARARRADLRAPLDIWPGFVDALSNILLVFVFLLVVFVLAQGFLGQLLATRNETLDTLQHSVDQLTSQLSIEQGRAQDLARQLSDAESAAEVDRSTIETQLTELTSLRRDIDALQQVRDQLEARVTELSGVESEAQSLRDRSQALETRLADEAERTALAQREIEQRDIRLEELTRQAATQSEALEQTRSEAGQSQAQVAELTRVINLLRDQLITLDQALDTERTRVEDQDRQIADLGARLNTALAERVEELGRFRSDFFGRLRQVLGDREDVRVVGDRFVFQSEVLFQSGDDRINEEGRQQLIALAETLKDVARDIPEELPWIIQVNGHTDRRPLRFSPRFPSNWELSTARAINVARILQEQGIPPERLAAAGFAEFQPIDQGDSEEAYRRNRRIEIKLTTR
ncbi:peptidoglycan -binding protein [Marinivivus vitaminiproducens]|uniref:peptidoglycan -binding protein n=1 Tax=Marinivivus vitaminiproducens TaxID=3035935 RepID=UPI0027A6D86B|nr:peptidoglycan -binding protein [Geminicoccaceae bacterium SCSIO 64248]